MTLKTTLLITLIGLAIHTLLALVGLLQHFNVMGLVHLITLEGSLLLFFTVFYWKQ